MLLTFTYMVTFLLLTLLIISLGFNPKKLKQLTSIFLIIACTFGTLLYGYGLSKICGNLLESVMRTIFAVFCMFLGRNEISALSSVPLLKKPVLQVVIYLVHLLALYATASAVVSAVGMKLIRSLRLMFARRGELHLIYGANDRTVSFAEKLKRQTKGFVILADGSAAAFEDRILRMGGLLFTTDDATTPTAAFLKKIGLRPGKRRLTVYCLDDNPTANLRYAKTMLTALQTARIQPEQTALEIILDDGLAGEALQAAEGRPGYGSVAAFERAELLARLMIRSWPAFRTMQFDENGRAQEDFEAIVVGFGATGRAVLRSLVMNGQFDGSRFHATVIAKDLNQNAGNFFSRYQGLTEAYNIEFVEESARSRAVYEQIVPRLQHLNYVAICTGSEKENAEIAAELTGYLNARNLHPQIVQVSESGVSRASDDSGVLTSVDFYTPEILCSTKLDEMAMEINHSYHASEGHTAAEDWLRCDYFSRMSCRAAADYLDAFLFACGTDRAGAAEHGCAPDAQTLETLSRTEHLRWCAFHYAMGYRAMSDDVFDSRANEYRRQVEQTGSSGLRIGKDTAHKFHACLIPWDALEGLDEKMYAATGKRTDYKEMDRENVRMILALPGLLAGDKGAES